MRLIFKSLTITGLTAACLLVMTPAEAQHFRDFGAIEMNTADARAAGISGIHLQREGSEDVPAEWIVSGDALGLEGEMLGLFEIRYPNENREIFLFARADESATYRVTVDDSENFFEFEQVGVEKFTLRPLCDASKLDPGTSHRLDARGVGRAAGTDFRVLEADRDHRHVHDLGGNSPGVSTDVWFVGLYRFGGPEVLRHPDEETPIISAGIRRYGGGLGELMCEFLLQGHISPPLWRLVQLPDNWLSMGVRASAQLSDL